MITENKLFIEPKKVYIPLTDNTSKIANVKVSEGDYVLMGSKLADKYNGKDKTPVIATISGTIVGFEERLDRFGKRIDHIVIENDFKEASVELEKLEGEVAPAVIRNRIAECGISQITVDGIYTDINFDKQVDHILINAIYVNEPFISTEYEYLKSHAEEIAEGIALLGSAALCKSMTLIVDKFMDEETLEALGKATVDKGIDLVVINSKKVIGWDYKIARKLAKETLTNNILDNGILYTSSNAAKMVYDAVREGLPLTTRTVAITGDAFRVNAIYEVKIGTQFIDISNDLEGYIDTEKLNLHVGCILTGTQLENDSFSITASVDSINVGALRQEVEDVCIKCGECNDVCPAGILPQNIMDAELRSVNDRIVDLNTNECVECGLCSYVCPSKINVLEWVRRAKRRVG